MPIAEVDAGGGQSVATGIGELDRVLGGGMVPGSATVLGGEPGIGKSTLLLQMLASLADQGARCLLLCAEESIQQVRARADRLGALAGKLWLASETSLTNIAGHVEAVAPDYLVVDSIQTVHLAELGSAPGSVAQVRECAHALVRLAKERSMATVLVGHVTKEGALAGPRVLEHVVDTVLSFEGDRHHALRLLRAQKHRFGPTGELGLFEMTSAGMVGVADAGRLFLSDRRTGTEGSAVVATMEGHRPLLVEVQALIAPTALPMPRRSAQGLDAGRLALLLAVLHRRLGIDLKGHDVYVSAAGGVRVMEPAADLALVLAVASSQSGVALPDDVVVFGEVGLSGELRQVANAARRMAEAHRLGFGRALAPESTPDPPAGMSLARATTLAEAVDLLGLAGPLRCRRASPA